MTAEPTGVVQPDAVTPAAVPAEPPGVVGPDGAKRVAGGDDGVRATSFLQRAALRRRLRYLRRRRELALRELGDLVFDSHQRREASPAGLAAKLASMEQNAAESEQLARALDERTELRVLREPGIAACASCAMLHGSEDRFCPQCGTPTRKA
jgi:NADH pyrophosphatase NudC (nudix superfamily)